MWELESSFVDVVENDKISIARIYSKTRQPKTTSTQGALFTTHVMTPKLHKSACDE